MGRARRPVRTMAGAQFALVLISGVIGVTLLALAFGRIGSNEVLASIASLRWAGVGILALGGLRFAVRALAWTLCVDPPERLGFRPALAAFIAGDALATLIPVGPLASEPAKVFAVRSDLRAGTAVSTIAVETLLYGLSVGFMLAGGGMAFLASVDEGGHLRVAIMSAILACVIVAVLLALAAGTSSRPLARLLSNCGTTQARRPSVRAWVGRTLALEGRVFGFARSDRTRWLGILALEGCHHVVGVLEVWWTLVAVLPPQVRPSLRDAFVLEAVNRLITLVFKMVPLRVGFDEVGSGIAAKALALGSMAGVSLALVRKIRILFWTGVGLSVLLAQGWSWRHPGGRDVGRAAETTQRDHDG